MRSDRSRQAGLKRSSVDIAALNRSTLEYCKSTGARFVGNLNALKRLAVLI
jgi:hypothetical protein